MSLSTGDSEDAFASTLTDEFTPCPYPIIAKKFGGKTLKIIVGIAKVYLL